MDVVVDKLDAIQDSFQRYCDAFNSLGDRLVVIEERLSRLEQKSEEKPEDQDEIGKDDKADEDDEDDDDVRDLRDDKVDDFDDVLQDNENPKDDEDGEVPKDGENYQDLNDDEKPCDNGNEHGEVANGNDFAHEDELHFTSSKPLNIDSNNNLHPYEGGSRHRFSGSKESFTVESPSNIDAKSGDSDTTVQSIQQNEHDKLSSRLVESEDEELWRSGSLLAKKHLIMTNMLSREWKIDHDTTVFIFELYEQVNCPPTYRFRNGNIISGRTIYDVFYMASSSSGLFVDHQEMLPGLPYALDPPKVSGSGYEHIRKYIDKFMKILSTPVKFPNGLEGYAHLGGMKRATVLTMFSDLSKTFYIFKDYTSTGDPIIYLQPKFNHQSEEMHELSLEEPLSCKDFVFMALFGDCEVKIFNSRMFTFVNELLYYTPIPISWPGTDFFTSPVLEKIKLLQLSRNLEVLSLWQDSEMRYSISSRSRLRNPKVQQFEDLAYQYSNDAQDKGKELPPIIIENESKSIRIKYFEFLAFRLFKAKLRNRLDDRRVIIHIESQINAYLKKLQQVSDETDIIYKLARYCFPRNMYDNKTKLINWEFIICRGIYYPPPKISELLDKILPDLAVRTLKLTTPGGSFDLFFSVFRLIAEQVDFQKDYSESTKKAVSKIYSVFNTEIDYLLTYDALFSDFKGCFDSDSTDPIFIFVFQLPYNWQELAKFILNMEGRYALVKADFLNQLKQYKAGYFKKNREVLSENEDWFWNNEEHFKTLDNYCRLYWKHWDMFQNENLFYLKFDDDDVTDLLGDDTGPYLNSYSKAWFPHFKYDILEYLNYMPVITLILINEICHVQGKQEFELEYISDQVFVIAANILQHHRFKVALKQTLGNLIDEINYEQLINNQVNLVPLMVRLIGDLLVKFKHLIYLNISCLQMEQDSIAACPVRNPYHYGIRFATTEGTDPIFGPKNPSLQKVVQMPPS